MQRQSDISKDHVRVCVIRHQDDCSGKQPGNWVSVTNLESAHHGGLDQAFQIIVCNWKVLENGGLSFVGESKLECIILNVMCASNVAVKLSLQHTPNIDFHFQLKVVFFPHKLLPRMVF